MTAIACPRCCGRRFASRRASFTWRGYIRSGGEKQQIDVRDDWSLLTEEERRRKADELIAMIRELREPPMQPPPRVCRWEEAPEEAEPGESGCQPRPVTGGLTAVAWYCYHCCEDSARSPVGQTGRLGSSENETPNHFFVARPGFGSLPNWAT
jgi:hypothetical protein